MKWLLNLFNSSIGQKLIMSLTGLFLCSFLLIHLIGNLQLLYADGGKAFNSYAYFMTNNILIKTVSWGLYAMILLHAIKGILMALNNRKAGGGNRYAVSSNENASWTSKNMAILGSWVFIFIGIHMAQFWGQMHFGDMALVNIDGVQVKELYGIVVAAYENPLIVVFYVVSMFMIGAHLWHGFGSAFQSLGIRHNKYTPIIETVGKVYSVLIPGAFAIIPIWMYFN